MEKKEAQRKQGLLEDGINTSEREAEIEHEIKAEYLAEYEKLIQETNRHYAKKELEANIKKL